LAADGADVVVNYSRSSGAARELVEQLVQEGVRALSVKADVAAEEEVIGMLERARSELGGPIDLLVNNAGIEKPFPLIEMPLDEWRRVLDINLTGAFLCAREVARALMAEKRPGVIVNVSSVHEVIPWPRFSHYCASKAGMKLFAQTIARELAPHGIRVVMVAPGAILTPINADLIENPEKRKQVEAEIPWGRIGRPEEVAAAIAWLAGPEAEYVTGTTLFVDGGMTLYPGFV
jgi:glucose 1-dehydrogenase